MKRALLVVFVLLLVAGTIAGCGLYKEYTIGAKATITDMTVRLDAELWEYVDSGLFVPAIHWTVDWGDGKVYTEADAISPRGDNWASTEPQRFLQWSHEYANPGHYIITISATNAKRKIILVKVG